MVHIWALSRKIWRCEPNFRFHHSLEKKKLWQSFSLLAAFINKECLCSKPNCWYVHLYNISEDRQLSSTWALFRQQPDWYQHITDILYQEICYKIRNQKYDLAHFWNQRNYFVYPAESAQRLFTLITTVCSTCSRIQTVEQMVLLNLAFST